MKRKILLLGASNTFGVVDASAGPAKGYKDHLQDMLGYRWNVVTRGAPGCRSQDWLPNAPIYVPGVGGFATASGESNSPETEVPIKVKLFTDYFIPNLPADLVVLQCAFINEATRFIMGTEAAPTPRDVFGRNVRDIVSALLEKGVTVMVPIDFPAMCDIQNVLDGYEEEIRIIWELHRENPHFVRGPDLRNSLNLEHGTDFDKDFFHPNNLGHMHAACLFAQKILAWEATQNE